MIESPCLQLLPPMGPNRRPDWCPADLWFLFCPQSHSPMNAIPGLSTTNVVTAPSLLNSGTGEKHALHRLLDFFFGSHVSSFIFEKMIIQKKNRIFAF